MTPEIILATVKSCADATNSVFQWLQTPEGQAFSKQMREDQAKAEAFWGGVGTNLQKFFSGEMFKPQ